MNSFPHAIPNSPAGQFPPFTFAFQPIVDVSTRRTIAYEALVRGPAEEGAGKIFSQIPPESLYQFDRECRVVALDLAAGLNINALNAKLSLNMLPRSPDTAVQSVQTTLEAAQKANLPLENIVLEMAEGEIISDLRRFATLTDSYRGLGLRLAIDDFGAGYSGLNLLADFQPDQIKLDQKLVRHIQSHGPRQSIVRAIIQVCFDLGIDLVVEGVETVDEYDWFYSKGVRLFQGYLFARPGFQCLPPVHYPALPR